jgi:hypothetical protein
MRAQHGRGLNSPAAGRRARVHQPRGGDRHLLADCGAPPPGKARRGRCPAACAGGGQPQYCASQRCHLQQVLRGRGLREVGLQVVGRAGRVDVAVLALQRHAVVEGARSACGTPARPAPGPAAAPAPLARFLALQVHLGMVAVAARGDLFLQVADGQRADTRCSVRGEGAHALHALDQPFGLQLAQRAVVTVMRLTPNCATSSASEGISAPGRPAAARQPSFRCCLTRA